MYWARSPHPIVIDVITVEWCKVDSTQAFAITVSTRLHLVVYEDEIRRRTAGSHLFGIFQKRYSPSILHSSFSSQKNIRNVFIASFLKWKKFQVGEIDFTSTRMQRDIMGFAPLEVTNQALVLNENDPRVSIANFYMNIRQYLITPKWWSALE